MKNKTLKRAIFALGLALVARVVLQYSAPIIQSPNSTQPPSSETLPSLGSSLFPSRAPVSTPSPSHSQALTSGTPETIEAEAPSIEDIRREVEKNPHETPPSLAQFAERHADRIEKAKTDERAAALVIAELKDCATAPPERTPVQVRTWCAINAFDLEARWKSLKASDHGFIDRLSPDVQTLLRKRQRIAR